MGRTVILLAGSGSCPLSSQLPGLLYPLSGPFLCLQSWPWWLSSSHRNPLWLSCALATSFLPPVPRSRTRVTSSCPGPGSFPHVQVQDHLPMSRSSLPMSRSRVISPCPSLGLPPHVQVSCSAALMAPTILIPFCHVT